ncbi:MAG: FAD-dependent monooxygenase, partial [Pseudomonadota bacterium]
SIGFGKNTDQDFNVFFNITEDDVKDSLEAGALVDYACAIFTGLDRRVDGILEVIDPANVRLYFPKDRPLSTGWSKGRVVLIGDAAHPCFQYTGLGAAMAIESALVLANALKSCRGHADAFRRFEKARLPRVKVVNAKSYQGSRLFGLKNALAATLRDLVMGLVPARLAAKPIFDIHTKEFLK